MALQLLESEYMDDSFDYLEVEQEEYFIEKELEEQTLATLSLIFEFFHRNLLVGLPTDSRKRINTLLQDWSYVHRNLWAVYEHYFFPEPTSLTFLDKLLEVLRIDYKNQRLLVKEVEDFCTSYLSVISETDQDFEMVDQYETEEREELYPLPKSCVLKDWLLVHSHCPYPSMKERQSLGLASGLSLTEIDSW